MTRRPAVAPNARYRRSAYVAVAVNRHRESTDAGALRAIAAELVTPLTAPRRSSGSPEGNEGQPWTPEISGYGPPHAVINAQRDCPLRTTVLRGLLLPTPVGAAVALGSGVPRATSSLPTRNSGICKHTVTDRPHRVGPSDGLEGLHPLPHPRGSNGRPDGLSAGGAQRRGGQLPSYAESAARQTPRTPCFSHYPGHGEGSRVQIRSERIGRPCGLRQRRSCSAGTGSGRSAPAASPSRTRGNDQLGRLPPSRWMSSAGSRSQ